MEEINRNYRIVLENYRNCQREKEGLQKQIEDKEIIINQLNEKIEKSQKENVEAIKKEKDEINRNYKIVLEKYQNCQREKEGLQKQIKDKEITINELNEKIEKSKNENVEAIKKEKDEINRNYKIVLEKYQNCQREKEGLQKQIKDKEITINELNEKIEKSQKENEEAIKKKNEIEKKNENLKSVIERFSKKNIWELK